MNLNKVNKKNRRIVLKNINIIDGVNDSFYKGDVYIKDKKIEKIINENSKNKIKDETKNDLVIEGKGLYLSSGFIDLHVHFRDPGFTKKEDVFSGAKAAVAGGFTSVCMMPNTKPVFDEPKVVLDLEKKYNKKKLINIFCACAMSKNQKGEVLVDFKKMCETKTNCKKITGKGVIGITEDGKTLDNYDLMEKVMRSAKKLGLVVMDHAEPEIKIIKRDIELAKKTGARLHIQHVSDRKSVELIRKAKKVCPNITAETAPHYFSLTKTALKKHKANAKMNPPLKTKEDKEAIVKGLIDGTIDIIATDHAPHTELEKRQELNKAPFGIIGLETAFKVANTILVKKKHLSIEELVKKMSFTPAKIIGLQRGVIKKGEIADLTIFDLEKEGKINSKDFYSKAKNTPFNNMKTYGEIKVVIFEGGIIYNKIKKQ